MLSDGVSERGRTREQQRSQWFFIHLILFWFALAHNTTNFSTERTEHIPHFRSNSTHFFMDDNDLWTTNAYSEFGNLNQGWTFGARTNAYLKFLNISKKMSFGDKRKSIC